MIILHLLSAILLYKISKKYLPNRKNRLWLLLVFVLLPGVISSAIIVETAGLMIFGLLFFVYAYENFSRKYIYIILSIYVLLCGEFVYLFLALSIFSIYTKQLYFFLYLICLLFSHLYFCME